MNVREIITNPVQSYESVVFQTIEKPKKDEIRTGDKLDINQPMSGWQKNILLSAIEKLENNMQVDDSHPLGRLDNRPIESFDEARIELSMLKKPWFKEQAFGAQANISPQEAVPIFMED